MQSLAPDNANIDCLSKIVKPSKSNFALSSKPKGRGRIPIRPLHLGCWGLFSNLEHFGAASGTDALGGRAAILHGDALGVLHLPLGATLYTVTLHGTPPLVSFGC